MKGATITKRAMELLAQGVPTSEIGQRLHDEGLTFNRYRGADIRNLIRSYCYRNGLEVPEAAKVLPRPNYGREPE